MKLASIFHMCFFIFIFICNCGKVGILYHIHNFVHACNTLQLFLRSMNPVKSLEDYGFYKSVYVVMFLAITGFCHTKRVTE